MSLGELISILQRDFRASCLGCFAVNLGHSSSFEAELNGVMFAIEIARYKRWSNLWIEADSKLAALAFKNSSFVLWKLKNRWLNWLASARSLNVIVSHIFREGNCCADKLANMGLGISSNFWWDTCPMEVRNDYIHNMLGLPSYCFA
jgi:hypothetical protein